MSSPVAGFVGPPGWHDPTPEEFTSITGVATIGVTLDLGPFDWNLDRIATTEPAVAAAAAGLVDRGASAIGIVGTPFGWAGLAAGERPHDRNERVASACGVPVVSAVSGVLDWLDDVGARRVALAATYYDRDWCNRWERFAAAQGYDVTCCASMADLGIVRGPLRADDESHWTPTPGQIARTVAGVCGTAPLDAVVVSGAGAGARTLASHGRLCAVAGVPVVSSDLGLYRALVRAIGPMPRRPAAAWGSWWPLAGVEA